MKIIRETLDRIEESYPKVTQIKCNCDNSICSGRFISEGKVIMFRSIIKDGIFEIEMEAVQCVN